MNKMLCLSTACATALLTLCSTASAQEDKEKKVLIIGIDGLKSAAMLAAYTPTLDALMDNGAYSLNTTTSRSTVSAPGWSSMLTGVWSDKHGVVDNSFEGANYEEYPHFFNYIEDLRPELFTASLVHWSPINTEILDQVDLEISDLLDQQVADMASDLLLSDDPDVLFLHFDDVDHAGHDRGFSVGSPPYISAIELVDAQAGAVMEALERRQNFANEDWLILVGTDHGGKFGGHGANIPDCRLVWMIASGESTLQGEVAGKTGVIDIAVTALTHLQIPIDDAWNLEGKAMGLSAN